MLKLFLLFIISISIHSISLAESTISIAVAANFSPTLEKIVTKFQKKNHAKISISSASTGVIYAQIMQGAPYDIFFSADQLHPELLEEQGKIIPGSRFTYAIGKLVLYSSQATRPLQEQDLTSFRAGKIAIANPDFSPYGLAAKQTLQHLQLWTTLLPHFVFGESISQTYSFVATGNAQLGLLALPQVVTQQSSIWLVPQSMYSPIIQQVVLLQQAKYNTDAIAFEEFLHSETVKKIIEEDGYGR